MPRLARIGMRLVLVNFVAGILLGFGLMLVRVGLLDWSWTHLRTMHSWVMQYGWLTQMVFVVAYWIFPRLPGRSRGNERPMMLALVSLNLAVLAVLPGWHLLAAVLLVAAVSGWMVHILPRVARLSPMESFAREGHDHG